MTAFMILSFFFLGALTRQEARDLRLVLPVVRVGFDRVEGVGAEGAHASAGREQGRKT